MKFVALTAARWAPIGMLTPVTVLVMQSRGLDLGTIGLVMATYTVTVAVLEIPTGGLADAFGDRRMLVAGSCFAIAKLTTFLFATTAAAFFAAAVLHGIDRALRSGPLEAWYVSKALADGRDDEVRHGLSSAGVGESVALGGAALLAGLVPFAFPSVDGTGDAILTSLTLPVVGAIAFELVHLAALFLWLPGGRRSGPVEMRERHSVARIIHDAGRVVAAHPAVRWLLLAPVTLGFALASVELLWQPRVSLLVGEPDDHTFVFGLFAFVAFASSAMGSAAAPRLAGRASGARRAAQIVTVGYGATIAVLAAAGATAVLGVAFGSSYSLLGAIGPLHGELLHERVSSRERATMLSLVSVAGMSGLFVASLTLPRIAEHRSIAAAWLVAAVVAALGSACYARSRLTRAAGRA